MASQCGIGYQCGLDNDDRVVGRAMPVRTKVIRTSRGGLSAITNDLRTGRFQQRIANLIQREVYKRTPVDTGNMRSKLRTTKKGQSNYRVGYPGVPYAAYVYNHYVRRGNDFLKKGIRAGFRRYRQSSRRRQ